MTEPIQTIILCGGLGARLREETEYRPKPMVPVGGKPILWHIMKLYAHYGYTDFILPIGYKGDMIKEYFCHYHQMTRDICVHIGKNRVTYLKDDDDIENWKVTMVDTGRDALKATRLLQVQKYVTSDIAMITYGDGVSDVDINKVLEFHHGHGKIMTLTGVSPAAQFGELKFDGDRILRFHEKQIISPHYISGGFMVVNTDDFYGYLHDNNELESGTFDDLALLGEMMVYKHPGGWACMDTVRDMEYLNRLWDEGNAFWKVW